MPDSTQVGDVELMQVIKREAVKASDADFAEIESHYAKERHWYAEAERYQNYSHIQSAVKSGHLLKVRPHRGAYHMPERFVNPNTHHLFSPYLAPHAHKALGELALLFRRAADDAGISDDVRISVTSMVRSQEYQNEIIKNGQLALPDSTHTTGGAFDVQSKGYFLVRNGVIYAVNKLDQAKTESITGAFKKAYGETQSAHVRAPIEWFDDTICQAIEVAVDKMALWGLVNKVNEFVGTSNQCFHIGVNPDFEQYHA